MSLFPALDLEEKIQTDDRTRFNGKRSFASKGADPLTTMTIKPGADESAINVFNSDKKNRYLDWQFTAFNIDIVTGVNDKLDFDEGGSELTATLTAATYTLAALAVEIKTQLDAEGALTYTVAVSGDEKITISATSSFALLPETGTNALTSILPILNIKPKPGFGDSEFDNITTVTGKRVRQLPKQITVLIGDGTGTSSVIKFIQVLNPTGDALFSSDQNLLAHRSDILNFLPDGRNSFLDVHRRAQDLIIADLDESGYIDINGDPLTLSAVTDSEEFRQWSTAMTLRIIHDENSNSPDDDFDNKARGFESMEKMHRNRSILRVDTDNDGKADIGEGARILGGSVVRR